MASSEAMKRAVKRYNQEKIDRISMRVPKGKRAIIQEHATKNGESINAFILRAVEETMAREQNK